MSYICRHRMINENARGHKVPSFYTRCLEIIVKELLEDCLAQRPDLFLIDFEILDGNKIRIVIDGDKGVLS